MKRCLQEPLNIPVSVSLLYEKEYENIIQFLNKKRRSVSEKRTTTHEKNKSIRNDVSPVAKFV